jgi:hypothetical protein
VTHDRSTMPRHFVSLIENQTSPGLIVVQQTLGLGEVIEELLLLWAASSAEDWRNQVVYLPL